MTNLSVTIIGGGIGGLALAHGLRRAGVRVGVYERTHERTDWLQGYRIHISPAGAHALHDCLPPPNWQEFLAAATSGGGFGFLTDRATALLAFDESEINRPGAPETDRHYGIGRIPLRAALLSGLDDSLRLGKTFIRYESADDRVTAHFADGTTATADVLIGADGANSAVRAQLLPHAHRVDTGVLTIAGRNPHAAALAPVLSARANIVIPRSRGSLFTAVESGQAIWGYSDAATRFPIDVTGYDGPALRTLVRSRIGSWSPAFHALIQESDPATINAFNVKSASPVTPWPTTRVTLLGDAIHNMTPMAGIGANTALRDAALLTRELTAAATPIAALHRYEAAMLDYGFQAVRRSLRNARQSATSSYLGRAAFRSTLRATAAIPPIRHAMARALGR
ncbi:FAD-dependent monooxygenase [Actinoplanes sp. KI2]|uniref:FAD-dependent oxidoreductase n=1 Tax=Actinoplanes sp. KI2 TaxID=2983315 RepID=UPI0021D5CD7E|nr:NAD(P)/FAD-dependent oxidoreductase [Actinoplanes sp. KI2]MCU7723493.1 FAD-dependent monooxygenase [Actinoplanes sp. KI2]